MGRTTIPMIIKLEFYDYSNGKVGAKIWDYDGFDIPEVICDNKDEAEIKIFQSLVNRLIKIKKDKEPIHKKDTSKLIPCEKCHALMENKCGAVCPFCRWIAPCILA